MGSHGMYFSYNTGKANCTATSVCPQLIYWQF